MLNLEDPKAWGRTEKLRKRREDVLMLDLDGHAPHVITTRLQSKPIHKDIKAKDVYNDLMWIRKNVSADIREAKWDLEMIREIKGRLETAEHPNQIVGFYNVIAKLRDSMRKRAGMYIDRVEHSGSIKEVVEIEVDDAIKESVIKAIRKKYSK